MEKLNEIVKKNIDKYEIKDFSELTFITNLISVIDDYEEFMKPMIAKKNIKLNKSFKYSYDFLNIIDTRYGEYLLELRNKNLFHVGNESYSDWKNDDIYISLFVQNNINDTYSITHELIHSISIDKDETTITRSLFCEVFSILGELLQQDFFARTSRPKNYSLNDKSILREIFCKKEKVSLEMDLIKTYLNYGYINHNEIINILSKYSNSYFNDVINHFYDIIETEELSYGFEQRYIIGYLLACYMHNRILDDPKKISEFIELNDNINLFEISEFINYLELEYEENINFNLSKDSYNKLEKSFVKELKRR